MMGQIGLTRLFFGFIGSVILSQSLWAEEIPRCYIGQNRKGDPVLVVNGERHSTHGVPLRDLIIGLTESGQCHFKLKCTPKAVSYVVLKKNVSGQFFNDMFTEIMCTIKLVSLDLYFIVQTLVTPHALI